MQLQNSANNDDVRIDRGEADLYEPVSHLLFFEPSSYESFLAPEVKEFLKKDRDSFYKYDALSAVFEYYEHIANEAKKKYHRAGSIALTLFIVVLLYSTLKFVLDHFHLSPPGIVNATFYIVGVLPLAIGIIMKLKKWHEHWSDAREVAEVLRHWRYRQFLNIDYLSLTWNPANKDEIVELLDNEWKRLLKKINAIDRFQVPPPEMPDKLLSSNTNCTTENLKTIKSAYLENRLELQKDYFAAQFEKCKEQDKFTESLASMTLGFGLFCTIVEGIILFRFEIANHMTTFTEIVGAIIGGAGIAFTILSIWVRIHRSASGISEDVERYGIYEKALSPWVARVKQANTLEEFVSAVYESERLLTGELEDFLRTTRKSNYFV